MEIGHNGLLVVAGGFHLLALPECPSCPLLDYRGVVNVELEFTIQLFPIK